MGKNVLINLGFLLANLALLALLQLPQGIAAMENDHGRELWQAPASSSASSPGLKEIVVPVIPRPIREDSLYAREAEEAKPGNQGEENDMELVRQLAKVIRKLPTEDKVIALTFDDGPKETVRDILAILAEKEVPATFFLLGNFAKNRASLVNAIVQAGSEIANHSWSHPRLTELSEEEIYWQIQNCGAAFAEIGVESQPFMRPPYGSLDERVLAVCAATNYKVLLWNVDTRDWEYDDPDIVLGRAVAGLNPGGIVLFHDGPRVTLQVLPKFIDAARAQGYEFVLISDYLE